MGTTAKRSAGGRGAGPHLTSPVVGRALMANPDIAFYLISIGPGGQFRIDDANEALGRLVNRPLSAMIGASVAQALSGRLTDFLVKGLHRVAEICRPLTFHRMLEGQGADLLWVTTLTPMIGALGEVTHVVGMTRKTRLEPGATVQVDPAEPLLESINATIPGLLHVMDLADRTNRFLGGRWEILGYELADANEMGSDALMRLLHPDDRRRMERHFGELSRLGEGEAGTFECRVRHRDGTYRDMLTRSVVCKRDAAGRARMVLGMTVDLSYRRQMEAELDRLSGSLLTMREDERRRIAGELHDSTAQHIVAAQLALSQLMVASAGGQRRAGAVRDPLREALEMLKKAEREIRILSFLMHPPASNRGGQAQGLASFAQGFGRRAGVAMELQIDPRLDQLEEQIASDIFRIVQEALTNIHRHAAADRVRVEVAVGDAIIELAVTDNGVGIAGQDMALGFGLKLVAERLERLGGVLELQGGHGTRLIARIPRSLGGALRIAAPHIRFPG